MPKRKHFKHTPPTMLYRWLKDEEREVNVFRFARALTPNGMGIHGLLTAAQVFSMLPRLSEPKPVRYHTAIPVVLLEAWRQNASQPRFKRFDISLYVRQQLRQFSGATMPTSASVPEYTGIKRDMWLSLNSHEVIKIKVLARALGVNDWQVVSMLMAGGIQGRR